MEAAIYRVSPSHALCCGITTKKDLASLLGISKGL